RRRIEERASTIAVQLEELHTEVTVHQQVEKENQNRITDLERQLREREQACSRATASFETERAERSRIEERASTLAVQLQDLHTELTRHLQLEKDNQARVAEMQRQLREREEAFAGISADLDKAGADRRLADEQLQAAENIIAELRRYPVAFEETKKAFARTQEELESRWQATSKALTEREAKLQMEASERQRLTDIQEA